MNLYAVAGVLTAFPFFYFLSFDPNLRVRVYLEINPSAEPTMTFDKISPPFGWAGLAPLAWVAGMGILLMVPEGTCSFHVQNIWSVQTLTAVASIALTSKVVFGPTFSTFKSLMLTTGMKMKRPWSYKVFDVATVYPVNFVTGVTKKLIYFSIAAGILWLLAKIGLYSRDQTTVLPDYVFIAMVFSYLGRMSQLYINLRDRAVMFQQTRWAGWEIALCFLGLLASFIMTVEMLEKILRSCGATPNVLPHYTEVVAGVLTWPVIEGILATIF